MHWCRLPQQPPPFSPTDSDIGPSVWAVINGWAASVSDPLRIGINGSACKVTTKDETTLIAYFTGLRCHSKPNWKAKKISDSFAPASTRQLSELFCGGNCLALPFCRPLSSRRAFRGLGNQDWHVSDQGTSGIAWRVVPIIISSDLVPFP